MNRIEILPDRVRIETVKDLIGCVLEIYYFDFLQGCYKQTPDISQPIGAYHGAGNKGYDVRLPLRQMSKIKCVILGRGTVLGWAEQYIGDKHRVRLVQKSREGDNRVSCVYSITSTVSLSKKVLYYHCPNSMTKMTLPVDLKANEEVLFTIKNGFVPRFMCDKAYDECLIIE